MEAEDGPGPGQYSYVRANVPFGSYTRDGRSFQETGVDTGAQAMYQPQPLSVPIRTVSGDTVKIGLWGSPASGKTTFLAALRHATAAAGEDCGIWGIYPLSMQSSNVMAELTHDLNNGRFPQFTPTGAPTELQWLFTGDISKSRFVRRQRRFMRREPVESRFVLDLIDVSGEVFGYDPTKMGATESVISKAIRHLFEARGIIYLFDPVGERDNRNSLDYVNKTMTELKRRFAAAGHRDPYLPHQVSVCITKFDHPDVFQEARFSGLVESGPDGIPRIPDRNAEEFFKLLCTGKFWSSKYEQGERSALFIMNELRNAFGPDKIEYFVMSSIGFWRPPGWADSVSDFDPEDFTNFRKGDEATKTPASIRGAISPINVLEPLIRLQQRIEQQQRRSGRA